MIVNATKALIGYVALLAEGVDRNWRYLVEFEGYSVALLAEGVDRNEMPICVDVEDNKSPSSRRAWIEIRRRRLADCMEYSRPPRGGRG